MGDVDPCGVTEEVVAHHEAGHAVVRVLFRIPFVKVSILPDGGTLGRVVPLKNRTVDLSNDRAFYHMTMDALSGLAAEERLVSKGDLVGVGWEGSDDLDQLFERWKLRNRYYPVCIEDPTLRDQHDRAIADHWFWFLTDSMVEAEGLVCDYWGAIETLATALLERKEMQASEVRQLVLPLLQT